MAGSRELRGAISTALSDPNFMAQAAQTTGRPLRQLLSQRLENADLGVLVVAAIATGEAPPFRAAEVVWREAPAGELQHQTIRWRLAPWAFADGADTEPSFH
jgi:hypothetical protein